MEQLPSSEPVYRAEAGAVCVCVCVCVCVHAWVCMHALNALPPRVGGHSSVHHKPSAESAFDIQGRPFDCSSNPGTTLSLNILPCSQPSLFSEAPGGEAAQGQAGH
jgi:hypothetical protein